METNEKLRLLRKKLADNNLDGYLVTGTDYHQSEYVAPYFRTRAFISGFTGSAGTVIVTTDKALLWVDSRYYIQGAEEIKGSEYELMKLDFEDTPDPYTWVERNLKKGMRLGVDGATISISRFAELEKRYKKKGIELVSTEDLLSSFWSDRPAFPFSKCSDFILEYAGVDRKLKIDFIRNRLETEGVTATFISSLDDIAWILNLRGNDVPHSPIFLSFLYISKKEAVLFTNPARFDKELKEKVNTCCEIKDYKEVHSFLAGLKPQKYYFDDNRINQSFKPYLKRAVTGLDFSTVKKAQKNASELEGMRKAHYYDGLAYAAFRARLEKAKDLDEIAVSRMFEEEREKMEGYIEPSFNPISGFGPHGAMCHYSATPSSSSKIDKSGLLVLDTGSQFEFGTTDLTRTLLFGEATKEQKRDYTLVLKGHLALASAWFIEGTFAHQLDVLAKQYLWQAGMSFYHGTGHGVGCRLNVHEGPCNISPRINKVPLMPGMVLSDEPGLYKEGRHGIRIENLVAVQKAAKTEFGTFYSFETLSVIPYERGLIETSLLSDIELAQINGYHRWVYESLKDELSPEALKWLETATAIIEK
jgi:Xaa-Pro aminopeptidase